MSLSAKQLALIPESELKHRILAAAGVEPPLEAISHQFDIGDVSLFHCAENGPNPVFVLRQNGCTRSILADEVIDARIAAPGIPSGNALRVYLTRWGWVPRKQREASEAVDPTAD